MKDTTILKDDWKRKFLKLFCVMPLLWILRLVNSAILEDVKEALEEVQKEDNQFFEDHMNEVRDEKFRSWI